MATNTVQHTAYLTALWSTLLRRPAIILVPLAAGGVIGLLIGILGPRQWGASQTFVVREELIGRIVGPGRFDSLDRMKTAQETISELARRPGVVRRTLQAIGPDSIFSGKDWPDEATVESVGQSISFYAAGGGDFGKTEVLTMQVKASTRERGRSFVAALFNELQTEVRLFRQERAKSMVQETGQALEIASQRYDEAMLRLSGMEKEMGADLSDLRSLSEPMGGSGELRKQSALIESEVRGISARLAVNRELERHLLAIREDSTRLLVTPRELLESQPVLARLKDRLVDAQFTLATASGNYTNKHPRVQAAAKTVSDLQSQIVGEMETAIAGLASQRTILEQETVELNGKIQKINSRLRTLAGKRAGYSQLVDEVGQAKEALGRAKQEMIQAEGIFKAAASVDLMTPVDEPYVTTQPLGPGKKAVLLGGLLAGAFVGIGLLMMATPVPGQGFNPPGPMAPVNRPSPPAPEIPSAGAANWLPGVAQTSKETHGPAPLVAPVAPVVPVVPNTPVPQPLQLVQPTAPAETVPQPALAVMEQPEPFHKPKLPVTMVSAVIDAPPTDEFEGRKDAIAEIAPDEINDDEFAYDRAAYDSQAYDPSVYGEVDFDGPVSDEIASEAHSDTVSTGPFAPEVPQSAWPEPVASPLPHANSLPAISAPVQASPEAPVAYGPESYFDSKIAPEIARAVLADLVELDAGSLLAPGKTFVIPVIGNNPFGHPGSESQTR
jgi:hypothetical protein